MKRLLFLLLFLPLLAISQTVPPDATPLENIQITNNIQSTTATNASVQEANGVLNRIPINALPITLTPVNYSIPNNQIISHLSGIDTRLGQIGNTTAGITNRIRFTGDNTTVSAGIFFASSATGSGSVTAASPAPLVNADNQKQYFNKDIISIAQPSTTLAPPGNYSGQLSVRVSPTPNGTSQRYTIEIYRCDNGGNPIASGVTSAPVGNLGVTVVAILDSGLVNLVAGSVTNISLSGNLASSLTLNTGERLRYHVSAEKVNAGGANVTMEVFYGSNYASYYDVTVSQKASTVLNDSGVFGNTVADALTNLDASVIHKNSTPETKTGVLTTYGSNVTDGTYNYSLSLQPIRNQFAGFFNQPFYGSDQGYYVFRPSGTNLPVRWYAMPNGSLTGTTAKLEIFNTDYSANFTTYNGVNLLLNNTTNRIDLGSNRGVAGGVRMNFRIGGDYSGSSIVANSTYMDFNDNNTVNLNPLGGSFTYGTTTADPFGISLDHQVTFKNPTPGQPMRFNLVGNGWAAGMYLGRDAIRTASFATQATTSDVEISTNPTNSGTTLVANMRIWAATGNIGIQNGGTFIDNGDKLQVTGNASGSLAASNNNHFTRLGEINTALALKANNVLTGYTSGAGTVSATDTVLQAIQKLNGNDAANARPYKSYTVALSQTSTSAPTILETYENTLTGTPVYAYSGVGTYTLTITGAFTANKTFISLSNNGRVSSSPIVIYARRTSSDVITFSSYTASTLTDGNLTNAFLEIRVYN